MYLYSKVYGECMALPCGKLPEDPSPSFPEDTRTILAQSSSTHFPAKPAGRRWQRPLPVYPARPCKYPRFPADGIVGPAVLEHS